MRTLVVMTALLLACKDSSNSSVDLGPAPAPVAKPKLAPAGPPVEVTARKLYEDYKANEVGADAKYRDKAVRVTGIVARIAKDIADEAFVDLAAPGGATIQARFVDDSALVPLKPSQVITIRCRGDGWFAGGAILQECVLEKVAD